MYKILYLSRFKYLVKICVNILVKDLVTYLKSVLISRIENSVDTPNYTTTRVDPSYLISLSHEIRSSPRLNSPACLHRSIFSLPSQICRPLFFVWKARSLESFLSKSSFFCKSSQSAGQVSFSLGSAPNFFFKASEAFGQEMEV